MGRGGQREYERDKFQEEIKNKDLAIEILEEENKKLYQEIEQLKEMHGGGIQDEGNISLLRCINLTILIPFASKVF